eukprot:COSAG01_NODE_746_length_13865_cov_11.259625_7_plen_94_part_00
MIISSTAHYGKFASDVLGLVGAATADESGSGAAPAEMLRALGEVASRERAVPVICGPALTEIHLCHARSCRRILRVETARTQGRPLTRRCARW